MLCGTCRNVLTHHNPGDGNIYESRSRSISVPHHQTIEDLYKAAVDHCLICNQLFRNWEQQYWDTLPPDIPRPAPWEKADNTVARLMFNQKMYLKYESDPSTGSGEYFSSCFIGVPRDDLDLRVKNERALELAFPGNDILFDKSQYGYIRLLEEFVALPLEGACFPFIVDFICVNLASRNA